MNIEKNLKKKPNILHDIIKWIRQNMFDSFCVNTPSKLKSRYKHFAV